MDPSEEKTQDSSTPEKKTKFIPAILVTVLLAITLGIGFFFYTQSNHIDPSLFTSHNNSLEEIQKSDTIAVEENSPESTSEQPGNEYKPAAPYEDKSTVSRPTSPEPENSIQEKDVETAPPSATIKTTPYPNMEAGPQTTMIDSVCDAPALRLNTFYTKLDSQPYIAEYSLTTPSEQYFKALIQKLLSNPPQVTRESDDLYTILKNTAHFFRISGKDNIRMMKGILDNEKDSIEQILADYYLLVTTPKCATTTSVSDIDRDALYEYACFFLNTMGGRLYLFRRDSLSRMVVTYYAILLVDRANKDNNNRHGIALKPLVNMLTAEMESGGSTLKHAETYLDTLYDMKETYQ